MSLALPQIPFWFIRHGQTRYNAAGLAQGALDIELNETGRAQAQTAAPAFVGHGITQIWCSPLRRARETAEIINRSLHVPMHIEADLREVDFGEKEGQPIDGWLADFMAGRYTPKGAESHLALKARVAAGLRRVLLGSEAPVLIVAHGGVLRVVRDLMKLHKEGPLGNALPLYCQPNASGWQMSDMSL